MMSERKAQRLAKRARRSRRAARRLAQAAVAGDMVALCAAGGVAPTLSSAWELDLDEARALVHIANAPDPAEITASMVAGIPAAATLTGHPLAGIAQAKILHSADAELIDKVCERALSDLPLGLFCREHGLTHTDPARQAVLALLTGGPVDPLVVPAYQTAGRDLRNRMTEALAQEQAWSVLWEAVSSTVPADVARIVALFPADFEPGDDRYTQLRALPANLAALDKPTLVTVIDVGHTVSEMSITGNRLTVAGYDGPTETFRLPTGRPLDRAEPLPAPKPPRHKVAGAQAMVAVGTNIVVTAHRTRSVDRQTETRYPQWEGPEEQHQRVDVRDRWSLIRWRVRRTGGLARSVERQDVFQFNGRYLRTSRYDYDKPVSEAVGQVSLSATTNPPRVVVLGQASEYGAYHLLFLDVNTLQPSAVRGFTEPDNWRWAVFAAGQRYVAYQNGPGKVEVHDLGRWCPV